MIITRGINLIPELGGARFGNPQLVFCFCYCSEIAEEETKLPMWPGINS